MTHRLLQIPSGNTRSDDCPQIVLSGGGNTSMTISVDYVADEGVVGGTREVGVIVFSDVLEFRWVDADVEYELFPEHDDDFEFGLVEIAESAYVEAMASRGPWRNQPRGTRIRGQPESKVKHLRMNFDKWGYFDVICTRVDVSSRVEPRP